MNYSDQFKESSMSPNPVIIFHLAAQSFSQCWCTLKTSEQKKSNKTHELTYRISELTAASSGEIPSLFLLNRLGCLCNKYLRQSLWPYSAQKWHGVFPSISLALMSAPAIKTAWITLKLPLIEAMWRGVRKLRERASILDPYSTKRSIRSTWPSFDATCSGVHPSEFCWLSKTWVNSAFSFLRILRHVLRSSFSVATHNYRSNSRYFFLSVAEPDWEMSENSLSSPVLSGGAYLLKFLAVY